VLLVLFIIVFTYFLLEKKSQKIKNVGKEENDCDRNIVSMSEIIDEVENNDKKTENGCDSNIDNKTEIINEVKNNKKNYERSVKKKKKKKKRRNKISKENKKTTGETANVENKKICLNSKEMVEFEGIYSIEDEDDINSDEEKSSSSKYTPDLDSQFSISKTVLPVFYIEDEIINPEENEDYCQFQDVHSGSSCRFKGLYIKKLVNILSNIFMFFYT
jgi:hypothetical protein